MPRSGNPFFPLINLMLLPLGLGMLALGAVALTGGGTGEMAWLFAALAASGAMMLGGAVSGLVRWRRWARREDEAARAMAGAARAHAADPAAPLPAPVLAHWTYDPADWSAFASREVRHRGAEAFGLFVGMVLFGSIVLAWQRSAGWGGAIAVSLVLGTLVGGGKWLIARSAHRRNLATPRGEVVITPTALLMNGRYQVLRDHQFRFRGARIVEGERPWVLELAIDLPTRSGPVPDTYRIPIPPGREDEARAVARALEAPRR